MGSRNPESRSVIARGLRVTGDITIEEPITVEGLLDGNLAAATEVEIGPTGRVRGDLHAKKAIVEGRVDGNLTMEDRVELRVTGRIRGDILAPRVVMSEGSFFRGRLTTSRRPESSDGPD